MRMLILHVLVALVLAGGVGEANAGGVLAAFLIIYLGLKAATRLARVRRYVRALERGTGFSLWFAAEVIKASVNVARAALARRVGVTPAVLAIELQCRDETVVTLVGCLLTLTPGTLAIDYEPNIGTLFVHALDADSAASVERSVRDIETRLLAWIRPDGVDNEGDRSYER